MATTCHRRHLPCRVAISIYLLIVHYEHGALVCGDTGVVNCSKVLTSPQSTIFRIPVSALGLAYFIAMAVICIPGAWCSAAAWLAWGRIAAAIVGIAMVIYRSPRRRSSCM